MSGYHNTTPSARAIGAPVMAGTYHCPELRPIPGRATSQATTLPSRRGNRLHHPCGKVTDLAGLPINPTPSA